MTNPKITNALFTVESGSFEFKVNWNSESHFASLRTNSSNASEMNAEVLTKALDAVNSINSLMNTIESENQNIQAN